MRKFDTPAPIATVVDVPVGRVHLIAADRADTAVEVLPTDPGKGRDVQLAEQTRVEFADGVLRIHAPVRKSALGSPGSLDVTVQLPSGSRVEAKTASADLRGVGRFGEFAYEGAQGAVKVDEAASLRVTTHAGDIAVGRLTGPAEISTSKGDIEVAEATRGTVVLRTRAGNVSVGAAAGVTASLDAGTGHGRVSNSLKNSGGPVDLAIHATTAYGDIAAHSR
ncbi:DUF4097 family beta strand repeat-containing protein [Actinokineospora sp. NPDC004072]